MIAIQIPGFRSIELHHLVMDYNGTLAIDGQLIEGVAERLEKLSTQIQIHVITANTFGRVKEQLRGFPVEMVILEGPDQARQKYDYVASLGANQTVAIGNGRNDRAMLKLSVLGMVTIQKEGAAIETIQAADVIVHDINDALDLLLNPLRLVASLRD